METDALPTDALTVYADALDRAQAAHQKRAELLAVTSRMMAANWKDDHEPLRCGTGCNERAVAYRPCPCCKQHTPMTNFALAGAQRLIAIVDKAAPTADTDKALAEARKGLIAAGLAGLGTFAEYWEGVRERPEFDDDNHGSGDESEAPAMPIATRYTNLENGTLDLHGNDRDHLGVESNGVVAVRHEADGRIVIVSPEAFRVPKEFVAR